MTSLCRLMRNEPYGRVRRKSKEAAETSAASAAALRFPIDAIATVTTTSTKASSAGPRCPRLGTSRRATAIGTMTAASQIDVARIRPMAELLPIREGEFAISSAPPQLGVWTAARTWD